MKHVWGKAGLLMLAGLPACVSDEEWNKTDIYENCAAISVPGYSPDDIQAYVIDTIKPAFAYKPAVATFTSQAKDGLADICVSWVGIDAYTADERLRQALSDLRTDLPVEMNNIKYR